MDTRTINLRDVPEDLVRRAKVYAAWRGMSLKGFILEAMQHALDAVPGTTSLFTYQAVKKVRRRKKR